MDHGSVGKNLLSNAEGRRRMERHIFRWLEDVGKAVRKTEVKRWRQKAVDRTERESVIKDTKAVRGLRKGTDAGYR